MSPLSRLGPAAAATWRAPAGSRARSRARERARTRPRARRQVSRRDQPSCSSILHFGSSSPPPSPRHLPPSPSTLRPTTTRKRSSLPPTTPVPQPVPRPPPHSMPPAGAVCDIRLLFPAALPCRSSLPHPVLKPTPEMYLDPNRYLIPPGAQLAAGPPSLLTPSALPSLQHCFPSAQAMASLPRSVPV